MIAEPLTGYRAAGCRRMNSGAAAVRLRIAKDHANPKRDVFETRRSLKLAIPRRSNERFLIVVAAPAEARAVLAGFGCSAGNPGEWNSVRLGANADLLVSGVGKANAAGATALAIAKHSPGGVLNLGVCGALPGSKSMRVGESVLASRCVFADEGIEAVQGWIPLSKAGFPAGVDADWVLPSDSLNDELQQFSDRVGVIATVSSCSGTDARAREIAARCGEGALAEAMEGAAVGLVASRQGLSFAELRVVSNRTGDRESQGWDLPKALSRLEALAAQLAVLLNSHQAR